MNKLFRAVLLTAAASIAAVGIAGCSSSQTDTAQTDSEDTQLKVGIIQMIENEAFNDMREGFVQELRDKGYTEDKLEIDYKCAQGDSTNLNTIVQSMITDKVDLIATIATPATQAVVTAQTDIPCIFIAVSSPVAAGVVTDMSAPDKNATGTSNPIPIDEIFELSDKLTPDRQCYGIIYNTGEVNAVSTAEAAEAYLDEKGISYEVQTVTNSSEIQQAAQTLASKCDAFFLPNDSMVQSAMPVITEIAKENMIPVYGSSAVMPSTGALATVAISDTGIGAISADKAIQYFEGTPIEDIPAEEVEADLTVINTTTADAIGVTIPEDIANTATLVE